MTLEDAINAAIADTGHERYRWLCSEENPDLASRLAYQALMLRMAGAEPEPAAIRIDYGEPPPAKGGCCGQ